MASSPRRGKTLHGRDASQRVLAEGARRRVPTADDRVAARIVGLDFDNSRVAWPVYDWMGVAKAAFESTARYLRPATSGRRDIRVNLVAAGPIRTIAARSIPGFEQFEEAWENAHRSAGTSRSRAAPARGMGRAVCPTSSPRPPARSSTSTAATTPSVRDSPPPFAGYSAGSRPRS